jgi:predicted transcriptional regulator
MGVIMATTIRLSDEAELRLNELAELLHLSKNAVIEKAVLEMDERTARRVRVRTAFDVVRTRDAELLERLSR